MINEQKRIDNRFSLQSIGKLVLCIYIILSFITSAEYVSSTFQSLSLYCMVGIAIVCFATGQKISLNRYLIWYFAFVAMAFVSTLYSPTSDGGTLYAILVIFAVAFSLTCFVTEKKDLYSVIYAFAIGATLLVLILMFNGQLYEEERLGNEVMGNANSFASFYMIAVILSTWYILYGEKKLYRFLMVISVVLNFYALLLSGGRKFVIIPFIYIYVALLFKTDRNGKKHIVFYTILIVVLVAIMFALIMNVEVLYDSIGVRMEGLFDAFFGEGGDASSKLRKKMSTLAWERGWESPIIGHGIDSFKILCKSELGYEVYSHNNYTEIWYNHGIIGLALYYSFHILLIVKAIKLREKALNLSAFIVAYIISAFVFGFGGVTYSLLFVQIVLALCAIVETFKEFKVDNDGENQDII